MCSVKKHKLLGVCTGLYKFIHILLKKNAYENFREALQKFTGKRSW